MRERMFATLGVWIALAVTIDRLLASLRYTVWESVPTQMPNFDGIIQEFTSQIANTAFVDGGMQLAVFVMIFLALCCATAVTLAMWTNVPNKESAAQTASAREAQKIKRTRAMRVQRLLAQMDEDELAALEEQYDPDDQVSVAQLLEEKRATRG